MVAEKGAHFIQHDHPDLWPFAGSGTRQVMEKGTDFVGRMWTTIGDVIRENRETWRQAWE